MSTQLKILKRNRKQILPYSVSIPSRDCSLVFSHVPDAARKDARVAVVLTYVYQRVVFMRHVTVGQ